MKELNWNKSFWFFDIDDTLIDTAGTNTEAASAIGEVVAKHFDASAGERVVANFIDVFETMLKGYRIKNEADWGSDLEAKNKFTQLVNNVEAMQVQVKSKFGNIKKWSREVFIKIAADRANIKLTPEQIQEAANAYWISLTEKTIVFPGALQLFQAITEHNRPIFLITSSDGRLKMLPDGQFTYEPEYSEQLKKQRIALLKEKGLNYNLVTVGDPEDKPHVDFFNKGINEATKYLGYTIDLSQAVIIGDSYAADLETPLKQLGFGLAVMFNKNGTGLSEPEDDCITTNNLAEVIKILK